MHQFLNATHYVKERAGEVRIGEEFTWRDNSDSWKSSKFHVLGVCEDIGPRLNGGFGGAHLAFQPFMERFTTVQSNRFLKGSDIAIHGIFTPVSDTPVHESSIHELDTKISAWVQDVLSVGGIPIVIGGGHNNAFGLIQGVSLFQKQAIDVVNCDPHADTRATNGRHSGNPFSYAVEMNLLSHYTVLGLHESYNNAFILDFLDKHQLSYSFYESWIDEPAHFYSDVDAAAKRHQHTGCGLELDMDAIAGMPSSAFTPSGITVEQARHYIRKMSSRAPIHYLHLPEAAPSTAHEQKIVGKTLVYLVTDFIKCQSNLLQH